MARGGEYARASVATKRYGGYVDAMPDQSGKHVLVTGANAGLGFHCARAFAAKGATVVLGCRNASKAAAAAAEIRRTAAPGAQVIVPAAPLDLASPAATRAFAAELLGGVVPKLDVLVNNAGVMALPPEVLAETGNDVQLQTNVLSPFLLTALLMPLLQKAAPARARVVWLTSGPGMEGAKVALGDGILKDGVWDKNGFSAPLSGAWGLYLLSKQANLRLAAEMQRRADAAGAAVDSTAVNPGFCATELQGKAVAVGGQPKWLLVGCLQGCFGQSEEDGSLLLLEGATAAPAGSLVKPKGITNAGPPAVAGDARALLAKNQSKGLGDDMSAALWAACERATGEALFAA